MYKDAKTIEHYAKILEGKTLRKHKISPSYSTIERWLLAGAVVCLHDGKTYELNKDKWESNKKDTRQRLRECK